MHNVDGFGETARKMIWIKNENTIKKSENLRDICTN